MKLAARGPHVARLILSAIHATLQNKLKDNDL